MHEKWSFITVSARNGHIEQNMMMVGREWHSHKNTILQQRILGKEYCART